MKRRAAIITLVLSALVSTGCGLSFQALPKPGGVSGPSYTVKAVFANALGLPIQARVLIGADEVGQVSSIATSHFKADLTLTIRKVIRIPRDTTAQILFVDPLGDEFIELYPPPGSIHGPYLANGATLAEQQTSSAPTIADTLAALGALLNGGGLNQLQSIVSDLNQALGGHQQQIRQILSGISSTVTALNANKGAVDNALTGLAALSAQLYRGNAALATGLNTIGPAVQVLSSENTEFSKLLTATNNLADVASTIVDTSSNNILGTIRQLNGVVNQMVGVESQLGPTLADLTEFETGTKKIAPGDYLQLALNATVNVGQTSALGTNDGADSLSGSGSDPGLGLDPNGTRTNAQAIEGLLGAGLP
jgi:phospholipid/cholesterol/gamma-HCH transport system substrate-binding protein